MAALPSCLIEGLWSELSARLAPPKPAGSPGRPRRSDRLVFDKLILIAKTGISYADAADHQVSATTIRRRRDEWQAAGLIDQLLQIALEGYDRMIGLDLEDIAIDGCITKAPCGGEVAGKSPVDRGKQGLKRSVATEGKGVPIAGVPAPANRHDSPLLAPTLDAVERNLGVLGEDVTAHLDAGYDSDKTRVELDGRGMVGEIAVKGVPAPIQAGTRWVVERTHAWMNHFKKLSRCTERRKSCVELFLALVMAIIVVRCLIREAKISYRW